MNNRLSTDKFSLRAPEPEDIDCMLAFENAMEQWSSNGEASGPYSKYQMKQYIENCSNNLYDDRQLRLIVEDKNEGVIGLVDICFYDPFANKAEVGIIILPSMRRKGMGEDVLSLFTKYCFDILGIHMLYAYIDEDNEASRRLFAKCGYKESGKLIDWGKMYGNYFNAILVQKFKAS